MPKKKLPGHTCPTSRVEKEEPPNLDICRVCGDDIKLMVFKHTGICSENCLKVDNDDYGSGL